jgi:DNA (cytosine-5)-methyltransferase 1
MQVVGLFAGIGGIELGLEQAGGFQTELLCESWEPARSVLADRFLVTKREIHRDVGKLRSLPSGIDVLTAGFPCTDLSQAGRTAGITGVESGLVSHVFRLLRGAQRRRASPTWLVVENVPNMLSLDRGKAMGYLVSQLESLGLHWAYRVVDSRFSGVPQRRRRVIFLASPSEDPRPVLFGESTSEPAARELKDDAFGFYWTEGKGGLGWAVDAVPTLKGGSAVGIPSPPAIWAPGNPVGMRVVLPSVEDAEVLQGFPRGWTESADLGGRNGPRWKLVGNAVTVGVARWLGERLTSPKTSWVDNSEHWQGAGSWPTAAFGSDGKVRRVEISEFPRRLPYTHLSEVVDLANARPLSHRAVTGFQRRLHQGNLGRHPGFREDISVHARVMDS